MKSKIAYMEVSEETDIIDTVSGARCTAIAREPNRRRWHCAVCPLVLHGIFVDDEEYLKT